MNRVSDHLCLGLCINCPQLINNRADTRCMRSVVNPLCPPTSV